MGPTHVPVRLRAMKRPTKTFEADFHEAEPLLGVTALESAGFTVDPASQTLKRLPAIPSKRAAAL